MDRVALYLQDAHPIRDGMEYAKYAEEKGFEAVWQAESRLVRDAIVPMAAFAAVTDKIKIGSGVINNWTRNAALIAATYLTLDDLAPDRVYYGIGAWWDPLATQVGIHRKARSRPTCGAWRPLFPHSLLPPLVRGSGNNQGARINPVYIAVSRRGLPRSCPACLRGERCQSGMGCGS